jgi:hypothetical protein
MPLLQSSPVSQAWLQEPQLLLSVKMSAHPDGQSSAAPVQAQVDDRHVAPVGHDMPHIPQFSLSDARSTQAPPHVLSSQMQLPSSHERPGETLAAHHAAVGTASSTMPLQSSSFPLQTSGE